MLIRASSGWRVQALQALNKPLLAQPAQTAYADQGRREVTHEVGDKLLLNTKNVRSRTLGTPQLMPRWIGPYKVRKGWSCCVPLGFAFRHENASCVP